MRQRLTGLAGFTATLLATVVCQAGESRYGLCGTPADAFFAEEIGLRREWIVQVPFDSAAARLEHVTVGDGIVIAAAGDGSLHGIASTAAPGQQAAGTVAWSRHFGTAAILHPPAIGGGLVVVATSFQVFGIDQKTGRTLWEEPLDSPPTAAAGISEDAVYVPLEGGRLLKLPVDPYTQPVVERMIERKAGDGAKKKSDAVVRMQPLPFGEKLDAVSIASHGRVDLAPLPFQRGVLWCTTDGLMTVLMPAKPEWQRLEFVLDRQPTGLPLVRDKAMFVATNAGGAAADVIRIDLLPIGMVFSWRTPIDEAVAGALTAVGDSLLVPLATGGMTAVAAADGRRRWTHEQPLQLLTVTGRRLWCIDATGRLTTIDPADGTRLRQFCLGPFRLPVVNSSSDRLVLASPGGAITMLAPRDAPAASAPAPQAEPL